MAAECSVNAAEVVTLEIGEVQVPQAGSAESAICREEELLALGIVDQRGPFTIGIDLDDLMRGRHFSISDKGGQRDKERAVGGKSHPVWQCRKALGINFRLAPGPVLSDRNTQAIVAGRFQHVNSLFFRVD